MKILITGTSGLIGGFIYSSLSLSYQCRGIDVVASQTTDDLIDIADTNSLEAILQALQPTLVVHVAAHKDLVQCEEYRSAAWRANVNPLVSICDYLAQRSGKLIYISSDMVFDGNNGNYSESDITCPINWYGATKLASELLILNKLPQDSISILRTAQVFGPVTDALRMYVNEKIDMDTVTNQSALPLFIKTRLTNGLPVVLPNNIISSPTPLTLIADVIGKIIQTNISTGILHVAGHKAYSRFDLGSKIADILELPTNLIHEGVDATAHLRPKDLSMNITKLQKSLEIKIDDYDILEYIKQQTQYA